MKEHLVDCTPNKRVLHAFHKRPFGWRRSIYELIDNSKDANAALVDLTWTARSFSISDDGIGISAPTLSSLFTLGGHHEYDTTESGEFGVGFKDAVLWIWGEIDIVARDGHQRVSSHVDLDAWMQLPGWKIPCRVVPSPGPMRGTAITLEHMRRARPSEREWGELMQAVGFVFAPAIESGLVIRSQWLEQRPSAVAAFEPRLLDPPVTARIEIRPGKTATIWAGILDPKYPHPHSGVQYVRGRRVIEADSPRGVGIFSRGGIYARVMLGSDGDGDGRIWGVSSNKERLDDDDCAELEAAVFDVLEPLLREASAQHVVIRDESLELRISELVHESYHGKRKRRPTPGPRTGRGGTSGRGGTGHADDQAGRDFPGPGRPPGLIIKLEPLPADKGLGHRIGDVIELSREHPLIARWRQCDDQNEAARELACHAMWVLETATPPRREMQTDGFDPARSPHVPARVAHRIGRLFEHPELIERMLSRT